MKEKVAKISKFVNEATDRHMMQRPPQTAKPVPHPHAKYVEHIANHGSQAMGYGMIRTDGNAHHLAGHSFY